MEHGESLTPEDRRRARDRREFERARGRPGRLLWLTLGPGVLAMLGENDAPSMLSYATTGAQYGVGFFLPFVVLTFAVAFVVQEMTIRLGVVTHRGHCQLIRERFGNFWGFFALVDLFVSNLLTLVTEFLGIRAGLGFFGIPPILAVSLGFGIVMAVVLTQRYWTWERFTLGLACFNLIFVPAACIAHPVSSEVLRAFLTWGPLPGGWNYQTILILMADIGATVTPWMVFFQQSAVVDKGLTAADIPMARLETALGTLLASVAAIATILATSPLFPASGRSLTALANNDFAQALVPHLGNLGATLFALGIFEAGLVAAITISMASAYAFGEVTQGVTSLNRPVREGWQFYATICTAAGLSGCLVLIPHAPLNVVILLVNVLAVLAMPPALVFLLVLANDPEVMGPYRNSPLNNWIAGTITACLCGLGLVWAVATVGGGS